MANRIIDAHDALEEPMASFVEVEGAKLAPAWPRGTPNAKGTSKLGNSHWCYEPNQSFRK